jgi:tRNA pseudouridine32 synthase/23S rRNA pseudouridine746 synthase
MGVAAVARTAVMDPERILFIDGEALVIDKPAGLPVDPPRDGTISLENHLESLRFGFQRWPTPVHRLDRDTSGCLLLARNPKAGARFQQAFENGTVEKRYLAVLDGVVTGDGLIDLPLAKVSSAESGWRMVGAPDGKPSRTHWRALAEQDGRTLVEFRPETGRTHQIRVHAASGLNVPVVGDPVYGRARRVAANQAGGQGMLLHAAELVVQRPGKEPITATAPLPERFGAWPVLAG